MKQQFIDLLAKPDGFRHLENFVYMALSGDRNKPLRQNVMFELTGTKLPITKCGIHAILSEASKLQDLCTA